MDDLISREAAIEHMKSMAGCDACNNYGGVRCRACTWDDATDIVDELPAVDAAPVVHARWKSVKANAGNHYPFWDSKCSVCGYTTAMTQTGWLYCPHCGARMDGEADG